MVPDEVEVVADGADPAINGEPGEAAGAEAPGAAPSGLDPDPFTARLADGDLGSLVRPSDGSWEHLAARLGVDPDALFRANVGLAGCATRESIPVNQHVRRPE